MVVMQRKKMRPNNKVHKKHKHNKHKELEIRRREKKKRKKKCGAQVST
jgi:ribosome assembly protein YihI (activator of Der GTPase)